MILAIPETFFKNHGKCYIHCNIQGKMFLFLSEHKANTPLAAFYQDNKNEPIFFYHLFFTLENDVFLHAP